VIRSRWLWLAAPVAAAILGLLGAAAPANASPANHRYGHVLVQPETATVMDSNGSGEGNAPYIPPTDTTADQCHRSSMAYAPLLAAVGVIRLPADSFRACSGATATTALTGQYGEGSQLNGIKPSTNLVLVQIGANPVFGLAAGICIQGDCSTDPRMQQVFGYLRLVLPGELDTLYAAIEARTAPGTSIRVVRYANPFDGATQPTQFCPYMTAAELGVAHQVGDLLNDTIAAKAAQHGFGVIRPSPLFRFLNACTATSAFFPVAQTVPQNAWLHPTAAIGQPLFTASVAADILTH
jgi:hypothetical protein